MAKMNTGGWYYESQRHSLAARGIPTGRRYNGLISAVGKIGSKLKTAGKFTLSTGAKAGTLAKAPVAKGLEVATTKGLAATGKVSTVAGAKLTTSGAKLTERAAMRQVQSATDRILARDLALKELNRNLGSTRTLTGARVRPFTSITVSRPSSVVAYEGQRVFAKSLTRGPVSSVLKVTKAGVAPDLNAVGRIAAAKWDEAARLGFRPTISKAGFIKAAKADAAGLKSLTAAKEASLLGKTGKVLAIGGTGAAIGVSTGSLFAGQGFVPDALQPGTQASEMPGGGGGGNGGGGKPHVEPVRPEDVPPEFRDKFPKGTVWIDLDGDGYMDPNEFFSDGSADSGFGDGLGPLAAGLGIGALALYAMNGSGDDSEEKRRRQQAELEAQAARANAELAERQRQAAIDNQIAQLQAMR